MFKKLQTITLVAMFTFAANPIARHTKTRGALPQSIFRTVLEPLRRFRTWRDRRLAVRNLERLDDRLLADIGLDRGQIRFVTSPHSSLGD